MNYTLLLSLILVAASALFSGCYGSKYCAGTVVKKEDRRSIVETEYGEVSAAEIGAGAGAGNGGLYHLQFITMEPNALFLPVLLHADMVLFIKTGSGRLSWADEKDTKTIDLRRGDLYRLGAGTVFHIQSNLEPEREKLRIHAIFSNTDEDVYDPSIGAYSSISDLVRGFDKKLLQEAFMVTEDVVEEILGMPRQPAIIHAVSSDEKRTFFEKEVGRLLKAYLISGEDFPFNKKKLSKPYNVYDADPDFENCNGWSLTVTRKDLHALKHSNIGVFMVNLTKGSMMGPHWNPRATEVSVVLQGQGMVRVVCSSTTNELECKNMRFRVEEGDVFVVPRFHPMSQMSYNNDSLVFMGFSTMTKKNYPQFLVGKRSVLRVLGREVLAASFNVSNATVAQLLAPQEESVILECTSCAEEEERIMEEEIEKEREEEEEREREEEEERRRQEEEEEEEERRRQEEEEEEAKRREEEERRRKEEEEERRRREEEEAKKREEEEEERRRQEEEEERRREEEEEAKSREEEEERRRREEEERRRREEEAMREEEAARRQEEEMRKRQRGGGEEEWGMEEGRRLVKYVVNVA